MKQKIYLLLMMLFTAGFMNGQLWQVDTGTDRVEEKWAVIEEPNHRWHVTIGNQKDAQDAKSCIWITCYDQNGNVVSSYKSELDRDLIVRDISLAPYEGEEPTFYVTGWSKGISGNAFFLGRMYRFGNFIWYTESDANTNKEGEGVAIVTAPNGDAVAVGHRQVDGKQIHIMRYSPGGARLWSKVHYLPGTNWMVREIDLGTQSDLCGPGDYEGSFVVVGEAWLTDDTTTPPTAFVSQYNSSGDECWRNLYQSTAPGDSRGDAAYDVVYDPITKNYQVVGAVDFSSTRGVNSSPYLFAVDNNGNQVSTGVYRNTNDQPLGCYPRCVSLGFDNNIVMSGPFFNFEASGNPLGTIFFASHQIMGAMGPLYLGFYTGPGNKPTGNSLPQPYFLNDAQPEDIVQRNWGIPQGYVISSNAFPSGDFANGDGVLLSTDINGQVSSGDCEIKTLNSSLKETPNQQPIDRITVDWEETPYYDPIRSEYPVNTRICQPPPCAVNCGFNFTVSGMTATFTNTSVGTGTLTYSWNFGDPGSGIFNFDSNANPTHTFSTTGTFLVCLTVINTMPDGTTCSCTICQNVTISCVILPSFTVSMNCYTGTFTSTSTGTGVLNYQWKIDSGPFVAGGSTYTYTFLTCGVHTITLRVCNGGMCPCQDVTQTVNIPCCNAVSNFCVNLNGTSLTVQMTPVTGTTYQIYDNNVLQTTWSLNTPVTVAAGAHVICVRATATACGVTCCSTCCKSVFVSAPCTLTTTFTALSNTTNSNITFTASAGATTNSWDFGDFTTGSTTPITHTYVPGTYVVCLTQTKTTTVGGQTTTCTEKVCKTIVVETPCNLNVVYTSSTCISTPTVVNFNSSGTTGTVSGSTYAWTFGDPASGALNTSSAPNPSHTFMGGFGYYTVCLTVTNSALCTSTICYRIRVSSASCNTSCTTLPAAPLGMQMDDGGDLEIMDPTVIDDTADDNGKGEGDKTETTPVNDLNLFPNPTSDLLNLQLKSASDTYGNIMIMSSTGEVVYQSSAQVIQGNQQIQIPTNSLSDGLYHVTISLKDEVITKHFTVAKN
jgi:PKD repeat protein